MAQIFFDDICAENQSELGTYNGPQPLLVQYILASLVFSVHIETMLTNLETNFDVLCYEKAGCEMSDKSLMSQRPLPKALRRQSEFGSKTNKFSLQNTPSSYTEFG